MQSVRTFIQEYIISRIVYSFPVQLLILNIKKNQILLVIWALLFGIVTQVLGSIIGIPYLFLDPEYMEQISFWSLFIMGSTLGGFTMSFHITCYILDGHKFSFLGNLRRPFSKFCFNNSVIPFAFLVTYIICFIKFQDANELISDQEIAIKTSGILLGFLGITMFFFLYFFVTNTDIVRLIAKSVDKRLRKATVSRVNVMHRLETAKKGQIRIDYYFVSLIKFKKVEDDISINKFAVLKIFDQNHFNAVIVQSFIFILVILLGSFRGDLYFQIPAGASVLIFFTIFVMFTGAFSFWLRGWAITFIIIAVIGVNYLMKQNFLTTHYEVYGLNYKQQKAEYSLNRIKELSNDSNYIADVKSSTAILNNWRAKFPKNTKPKMVLICTSGGGQRASMWTMRTLQVVDSTLGGKLMEHAMLITGASGGLVGAAYFRELYLRKQLGEPIDIYSQKYLDNTSKDNLNTVVFSLVVNDLFFQYQKFKYNNYEYYKDRGYAFEEQLNKNTESVLNKSLCEYKEPEMQATIPMMILSPTIVNDGRRLYISPQNISYMNAPSISQNRFLNQKTKGVEFLRFFKDQDAESLRFLSALRMSATFPYITPNVKLPSQPEIEIMDAGISDNFGVIASIRFLFTFREWIQQNTSGIIFISIRDTQKDKPMERNIESSLFQRIFTPIGTLYTNWEYIQDINNDDLIEFAQSWFKNKVSVNRIEFQYVPISKNRNILDENLKKHEQGRIDEEKVIIIERAALSWHLTTKEKESIKRTIFEFRNQSAIRHLKILLKDESLTKKFP